MAQESAIYTKDDMTLLDYKISQKDSDSARGGDVTSLVGDTPLLSLQRLSRSLPRPLRLFAKAEWFNPSGSVKDRPALNIIQSALANGDLGSGKTAQNLLDYIARFSDNARVIFDQFDFTNTVTRLNKAGVLYKICQNFAKVDLHPDAVPDRAMSNLYEHLIRRFGAEVNEGAEDFMTPRDVVNLATSLLLDPDDALFESSPGLIRTLYDQTCGTGGFLSDAMNHVADFGSRYKVPPVLVPYGQELEPETHAVCLTAMMLRTLESDPGRDLSKNIKLGSTLSADHFQGERFHYSVSNPPFGKKWEKDADAVNLEHKEKKYEGRFGPGLPRINDGSMLFLLNLASKMELPANGGGRAAIVLSGSPLFNGGAGSGESEIRRFCAPATFDALHLGVVAVTS